MSLQQLLAATIGETDATRALQAVAVAPALLGEGAITRAHLAQALSIVLFQDLLARVPSGRAAVEASLAMGDKVVFDHGALRTVAWPANGHLPSGREAIARVLEALGYRQSEIYPLERLKMTGYSYTHLDFPESIAQYFVSEFHPERFSSAFQAAVTRVVSSSVDPLTAADKELLARVRGGATLDLEEAVTLIRACAACFARHHAEPALADYNLLKAESSEMAWISTEGNAFNHATNRVADVFATAEAERNAGRAIKDQVEVSRTGRVKQTALIADKVVRGFIDTDGSRIEMVVPGSFFEFITREKLPNSERLDLAFDAGNATGIFKVTAA
jgi:hypothetical protein